MCKLISITSPTISASTLLFLLLRFNEKTVLLKMLSIDLIDGPSFKIQSIIVIALWIHSILSYIKNTIPYLLTIDTCAITGYAYYKYNCNIEQLMCGVAYLK